MILKLTRCHTHSLSGQVGRIAGVVQRLTSTGTNKTKIKFNFSTWNLKIVWSFYSTIWSTFEDGIFDFVFFLPKFGKFFFAGWLWGSHFSFFRRKIGQKTWKDPKNMNLLFSVKFNLFIYCVRPEADMQWRETKTDQIWSKKKK